ncbi:hypothetical protein J2Z35_002316 [Acetoanaerobium pronyense]|uniref:TrbL/VirB6 plasmid conjugal transfer protein n=1 Tax=Acetoanaerobium pronyense TaxID=1482736 RepID=A0ABS4KMN8_9FIRM|nr:CD0415/CD1112 family protein [Acetoanaerobium pronyense]MBP2028491.1 hypothetical protein [Acetoanaerobium pronyense]
MWVIDQIIEYIRKMLISSVISKVEGMFDYFNETLVDVSSNAGASPMSWNSNIYGLVRNISDNIILPIAALIITFILCYELIQMVNEKNNMHDIDTFNFFKYVFKAGIAVYLLSNTFNFVMAFFDVGASLTNSTLGIVTSSNTLLEIDSSTFIESLNTLAIHELITLILLTSIFKVIFWILSMGIFVILAIRMVEIYFYISLSPVPFATFGNKEWSNIGINYTKVIFAYALQGVLIILGFGIYSQLVKTFLEGIGGGAFDFTKSLGFLIGISVVLLVSLIKSNSVAKSVLNAH